MKKIFITGFTGQVGSQLAEFLHDETDVDIVGFMRWQEPLENISEMVNKINNKDRIFIEYGDLTDQGSLLSSLSKWMPDIIFHLGAQSYPKTSFDIPIETLQTNIIGTANLLESVRRLKNESYDPTIHVCSSSEVYGKSSSELALTEDTPLHGSSPYSISKIGTDFLGRYYAEAYSLKTFITRMGTHSGKRRSDVFFESTLAKQIALIEAGYQSPQIKLGNLESVRTFQDVRDAIRAYWLLAKGVYSCDIPPGEVFNIAGTEKYQLTEIVDMMLEFSTRDDITIVTDANRLRAIDADYQMFDSTKIQKVIDWKPEIPVTEMLLDLLEYWRGQIENGKIPLNR